MEIVIYGDTDRRPIVYTLLKLLQPMGDVALLTTDRHYKRLVGGAEAGELENIFISVGDYTPDEVFEELDMDKSDYEFIIYDGLIPTDYDMFMHVSGCIDSEEEIGTLECIDDVITIPLGYGNKNIPYSVRMFQSVEEIEGYRALKEVDPAVTKVVAQIFSPVLNMSANDIRKVVARKR